MISTMENMSTEENKSAGQEAGRNVIERMQNSLDSKKAGIDKAALRIAQALDAKSTQQFCFQGTVVKAPDLVDHKTRLSAAKIVVDIFGATAAQKHEFTGKDGGPIETRTEIGFSQAIEELLEKIIGKQ